MARLGFLTLLSIAIAVIGCRKKQTVQPVENVAPAAENAAATPLEGTVDPFMTSQLQIFIQQNGRLPKDFAEFAHARLDSVPRMPAGKRWAIDPATSEVKLVNR